MSEQTEKFNQRFDLSELKRFPNDRNKQQELFEEFYFKCVANNLAPFISDFIVEGDSWGCIPMIIIAENENARAADGEQLLRFKVKVRSDKWGNKVRPGDIITHFVPSKAWRGASPTQESRAKQMGKYTELYKKALQYKVDEKGCIAVPFHTASFFLQQYGVHSFSGYPITTREQILSEPIPKKRGSKEMGTVHYWLYEEVTEEQHEALPVIGGQQQSQNQQKNK